MLFFNIHNIFSLSIKGDITAEFEKYFIQELGYFQSKEMPVNLEIELKEKIKEQDDNYFYLRDPYSAKVGIFSKAKVRAESNVNPGWLLKDIIEPLMLLHILGKGYVFLHASAVEKNSKGYIFAALPQTGKTNILLSLLKNGYSFLADEMVIISKEGKVYSYPRPISLYPYNLKAYPEFKKIVAGKMKMTLLSFLQKFQRISFLQNPRSLFSRALKMAYTRITFQHFPLQPSDISAITANSCPLEKIFLLVKSETIEEPVLKKIKDKKLFATQLWAGILGEKSRFFAEIMPELIFLFPAKKALLGAENLKLEEGVLFKALQNVKCFKFTLPTKLNYAGFNNFINL